MVTSPSLWILVYVITAAILLARSIGLPAYVRSELQHYDARRQLTDENLEKLAINSGIFLGVLLSLFVLALFYSLASAMERSIFRPALVLTEKLRVGMFFLVAALCTLPVQVASLALGVSSPRDHWLYQTYLLVAAAAGLLLFWPHWKGRPKGRVALLFLCTLTLAMLSSAT